MTILIKIETTCMRFGTLLTKIRHTVRSKLFQLFCTLAHKFLTLDFSRSHIEYFALNLDTEVFFQVQSLVFLK